MAKYKIRDKTTGLFSGGIVKKVWKHPSQPRTFDVRFSKTGKVWSSEHNLKQHLLKCATAHLNYADWEVIEIIEQPTKPILEWFDAKMLTQVMK